MLVTPLAIVMEVSEVQKMNVLSSITVTPLGILIEVREIQLMNA